jgi:large subunit ribosomal protein L32
MAVPKGKVSKARRNSRNSANFKVAAPTLVECPNCHEMKLSHVVCKECGYYNGKKVVETKKETKSDN